MIKLKCPSCQVRLKFSAKYEGVSAPCPKCGDVILALSTAEPYSAETIGKNHKAEFASTPDSHSPPGKQAYTSEGALVPEEGLLPVVGPEPMIQTSPDILESESDPTENGGQEFPMPPEQGIPAAATSDGPPEFLARIETEYVSNADTVPTSGYLSPTYPLEANAELIADASVPPRVSESKSIERSNPVSELSSSKIQPTVTEVLEFESYSPLGSFGDINGEGNHEIDASLAVADCGIKFSETGSTPTAQGASALEVDETCDSLTSQLAATDPESGGIPEEVFQFTESITNCPDATALEDTIVARSRRQSRPNSEDFLLDNKFQAARRSHGKRPRKAVFISVSILIVIVVFAAPIAYFHWQEPDSFNSPKDDALSGEGGRHNLEGKAIAKRSSAALSSDSSMPGLEHDIVATMAPNEDSRALKTLIPRDSLQSGVVEESPNLPDRAILNTAESGGLDEKASEIATTEGAALPDSLTKESHIPQSSELELARISQPETGAGSGAPPAAASDAVVNRLSNSSYPYPAPGPDEPPLTNVHGLVDAFFLAPSWRERISYIYRGGALAPVIEEYYRKSPDFSLEHFKIDLLQMESDEELGERFWVFHVSESDIALTGLPMIVRVEDGNLKVDWEIFSEFADEHFAKFLNGDGAVPQLFRLFVEPVSVYPGSDRVAFSGVNDYLCCELNPPYGGYREFAEFAFVKKGTPQAAKLIAAIDASGDPVAVMVKLERKNFPHGIKHTVISEFVGEGWFD